MRALIDLILALMEFLEAELALCRDEIIRLMILFMLMAAGTLFFVGAMGLVLAALFATLDNVMSDSQAYLITSLVAMGMGAFLFAIILWRNRS